MMKTGMRLLPLFAVFFLGLAVDTRATDYFISPAGSDVAGDGSIGNPWLTLAHALDRVQPGDALYLRGGEYHEQLITVRDGAASAPITIAAYADETAVIDGTGVTSGNNGCLVSHSYLRLRGLTVRDWLHDGIAVYGCSYLEFRKLTVTAVGAGISLKGTVHDFIVDSCLLYDYYGGAGGYGFDATPEGTADRIYNGVISNSKAYINAGAFDNADGFALGHDGVSDIRFHNCETWGIGDGFDISGSNILLTNCSAHNATYGGGYKLWRNNVTLINCVGYDNGVNVELDYDATAQRGVNARLVNCTFHGCYVANIGIENPSGGSTLEMYNCIISGGDNTGLNFYGDSIRCYSGDYNLFHMTAPERAIATSQLDFSIEQIRNGEWTMSSGQDAHSLVVTDASSLFRDSSRVKPDLHLQRNSAAINGGGMLPDAPSTDFDGRIRVAPLDIGAFEYDGSVGLDAVGAVLRGPAITAVYPNPVFGPAGDIAVTYALPNRGSVVLSIADASGRDIFVMESGTHDAGLHERCVRMPALRSGTYYLLLRGAGQLSARRIVVLD